MTKPVYVINPDNVQADMGQMWSMVQAGLKGGPVTITLGRSKRTVDQNAKLWAILSDISKHVVWHGSKLQPCEWKDVITAALKKQKCVPGIDGGLVFLGSSTSQMSKSAFCELIEAIYAFGADQGVEWSEPAMKVYEEYERG